MREPTNEEKIALGAGLILAALFPIALGLAGVAVLSWGIYDEYFEHKKK